VNTSVIWIAPPDSPRIEGWLGKVRGGGLLPVRVDSAEAALRLLTQFRAGAVVYQAMIENGAGECERLAAAGAAVVAMIEDHRYAPIYLAVGCAAAVTDRCPGPVLVGILKDVTAGKRNLVWPAPVGGAAPVSAAG
jgi:hypothetical protein